MKRIVYTNDFLFHGQESSNLAFHEEWYSLFQIPIQVGTGAMLEKITDCKNGQGEVFSRSKFYALSGISGMAPRHFAYEFNAINNDSWEYFKSFFERGTFFIGAELGSDLRKWMTDAGYVYVNFWYHPYKLLDDIFFLVASNDPKIYGKLLTFRIPYEKLRFYSRYYATQTAFRGLLDSIPIKDNCCLFIGQTFRDKSVQCGSRFLTIVDFREKVAELAKEFSKIYYIPHPCAEPNPVIDDFIRKNSFIELLEGIPTYHLLSSPKVAKVVSLSSSVVYEAGTFGKQAEYLYKPLFDIDGAFSLDAFASIYEHYFAPSFWRSIFGAAPTEDENNFQDVLMDVGLGKVRHLVDAPWGFKHLGRLEQIEESIRQLQSQATKVCGFVDKIKTSWPYKLYSCFKAGCRRGNSI